MPRSRSRREPWEERFRRPGPKGVTEIVGTVGPAGADAVSTGRGWELEFTLRPWRRDPPPGFPPAPGEDPPPPVDRSEQTTPLVVRGPVGPDELDRLRSLASPGAVVRIAAAIAGEEEPWARLEEVMGAEPDEKPA